MPNNFKNDEQRMKWNTYNNKYSKSNYKTVTFKLSYRKDQELINYLESQKEPITVVIRNLIKEKI